VSALAADTPPINPKTHAPQATIQPPPSSSRVRLQYLARRLHALGEKPLFHLLDEVERGAPLRQRLEKYAKLPPNFIRSHGGDRFAEPLFVIDGGRGQ
jgi:hypothetical protein